MNRILLAQAMGRSPAASQFRDLITSANKYGLISGNFNSEVIALTPLGQQYTAPVSEEERLGAERAAIRKVPIFNQILQYYNNNKLPPADFLKNALARDPFSVPPEWTSEVAEIVVANGKAAGLVRTVSGGLWVMLDAGPAPSEVASEPDEANDQREEQPDAALANGASSTAKPPAEGGERLTTVTASTVQRQFFIAHGKNRTAVEQLKKILGEFDIPYIVAEEEPNVGRPISQKVADLMKACSAGIFIFTGDEEFQDKDGNKVLRPRENVIYELGAAALIYGRRIVILKEEGVSFPTDFSDLGYIAFDKDNLQAKSLELLKELIGLKAVRILPGA
jgi:predicted nucleotide-binding protein